MREVAFCLVENEKGEVLFVQRGYGGKKGKWSLPGGLVDRGESSRHAAYRETKEETGIVVKITHRLYTGNTRPIQVFVGQRVGGRLRFQKNVWMSGGATLKGYGRRIWRLGATERL